MLSTCCGCCLGCHRRPLLLRFHFRTAAAYRLSGARLSRSLGNQKIRGCFSRSSLSQGEKCEPLQHEVIGTNADALPPTRRHVWPLRSVAQSRPATGSFKHSKNDSHSVVPPSPKRLRLTPACGRKTIAVSCASICCPKECGT